MEQQNMRENKMGVMPVGRLLLTMSIPMMLSMLVQALYNVVDSIFVAQLNEEALTAVSLAFPIQNLMIAVGSGTSVGVNAAVSKALGEKKHDYANKAANNGLWLSLFSFIAFAVFVLLFGKSFYRIQTNDELIVKYGIEYVMIVAVMSFGIFFQMMLERLLQSTGKTVFSMCSQMTGAVVNLILDPILIFGMFGFPRLEVAGAALATVTGQICGAVFALILNRWKNKELHINPLKYLPDGKVIRHIYSVGVPSIIMMAIGSIMNFGLNKILLAFTSTASAVFGVYFKLQSFIFMPIFGLNSGMIPIIAFNFGARKPKRITHTLKLSIIFATSIMVVGCILFHVIPETLLGFFNASDRMLEIGIPALKTISWCFLGAGFGIISSSFFQAMGHGFLSLVISVIRQLVVILPAAYLLSLTGVLDNIWWSFPISEIIAAICSMFFVRYVYKKEVASLEKFETYEQEA